MMTIINNDDNDHNNDNDDNNDFITACAQKQDARFHQAGRMKPNKITQVPRSKGAIPGLN